ncbi:MAG: hypothetical protein CBC13_03790 [Planctomycetia bacterium TMED53]|nr:MAG: hypothetical protein CBC13_03790 [Planctomycetia bacterium TMED53]
MNQPLYPFSSIHAFGVMTLALVLSFSQPLHAQTDFDECGIFDFDCCGCVLFYPASGNGVGYLTDAVSPPIGEIVRITAVTWTDCVHFCAAIYCLTDTQLFFDCSVSAGGESNCSNGQDDDSDGLTDCCDPDCACTPGFEICDNGFDDDCDGFIDLQDPDCSGSPPGGVFVRGDSNGDGNLDVSDAVRSLTFLFQGAVVECLDAVDVSDDGEVNIADPVALLNTLFSSSGAPPPPYPDCGFDPTTDGLHCWGYFVCP